ncbi:FAD-binding oxidoreductase [Halomarina halobia]|uniref:D-lactate dehydrogenase (cytochrome) n=1 Tax=Halomarina halobia TaxID=3033386 RepID=A0ABD6A5Q9_9EURY|nr:FAD-binding oxidoreductase [Halomarina sp. PSR21]
MAYDCSFLADLDVDASFEADDRESHAADWGAEEAGTAVRPDAVVWPGSTEEVAAVLAAANERGVPVTPYAAGTSLEGNAVPVHEGISMDVTRMDAILDVRPDDFQVDVQPGIIGERIDEALAEHGLFFPPMPASADISTIGGMIVNDASGMKTVKYGEVGDWVLELEAVLADGSVIKAGSRAVKTSAGYNLKDLLVGSEGTLAVVTRATLELERLPEQVRGGRAVFADLDDATTAIFETIRSGVDVATIELIDDVSAGMANDYLGTDLPDAPMVFLEFHADHGIEAEIERCREAFEANDVVRFEMADDEAEMAGLWRARREFALALQSYDEVLKPLTPGDITVPISKYPDVVRYAKELSAEHDLIIPTFGHAGDGNVHYSVFVDKSDPEMLALARDVHGRIVRRAIEFGGTCTGEHGVGLGKREYLELEHGPEAVEAMRRIKRALDPRDTLNPGKIFPETAEGRRVVADPDLDDD